jgi:hypothetical protein
MSENYGESGQGRQWEFKLPDLDLDRILRPDRYGAKQELPILEFQEEFLDTNIPKEERIKTGDFAAFADGIISANPELIDLTSVGQGVALYDLTGKDKFIDINSLDCSGGVSHSIEMIIPNAESGGNNFTSYYGNIAKDGSWIRRRDIPAHGGGEQFLSFVSDEEIRALGGFIKTEFGLNVPKFDPENYKEI